MELKNKVVVITGSSSGIGEQTAYAFAKEGASIVITYNNNQPGAAKVEKKTRELGASDTLVVSLDVTDNSSIKNAIKKIVKKFGKIDILVNNAGVVVWKPLSEQTFGDIENQIRTNLEGLIKVTREALPHTDMMINIASGAGKTGYSDLPTYCATKFGVRGFTQSLADDNKKAYSVNPGMTATKMTNFKGVPPEKVAAIIVNTAKGKYKTKPGGDVDIWEVLGVDEY
jgi:3-oxoacyl-[acyl-carrier protein] reductase